jgi:hypothetical protein
MCKDPEHTDAPTVVSDDALIENAGKVTLDPPEMWGRGIVADFKRTVWSHWREGMLNFNQKTIAVTLLLFISVIAPTLTFGAVYGKVTGNNIGAIEVILGTSWVGIAYSLFGGMPVVSPRPRFPIFFLFRVLPQLTKASIVVLSASSDRLDPFSPLQQSSTTSLIPLVCRSSPSMRGSVSGCSFTSPWPHSSICLASSSSPRASPMIFSHFLL